MVRVGQKEVKRLEMGRSPDYESRRWVTRDKIVSQLILGCLKVLFSTMDPAEIRLI